ncbi:MAG: 30S ribosomal protein S9 [Actinobacteria bacterium]|nr:30S ribosomal protein S9 [Actinomycetota bacterium]
MSDETNETSEQSPEETTEGQTAETAGPVADEVPSSSQAAGEDTPSAPPADDGEQAPAVASTEEEPGADASDAGEEAAPEPEQERAPEPVAKEEKKDVIPGANLEPIAIEPDAPELSAEERARLEAEEEEKARREAELAAAESESVADRAPAKMESGARFLATGKRKRSIARVTLVPGDGKFTINGRELAEFFPRPLHQTMARQPLTVSGYEGNVDVRVRVHGGGISGQAGAVRHGIARALTEIDAELRGDLKRRGFLTRDARVKERRKAGFKKARKKPQFSKR